MFSELLKRLRTENGVTQPQLAEALGVSKGNVADWETGKSLPGYKAIIKLAKYFDVSADYILGLSALPKTPTDAGNNVLGGEQALLDIYRMLDAHDKEELFQIAILKAKRSKGKL